MAETIDTEFHVDVPPESENSYRYVRLVNGVEVCLISDPRTETSAAAMCVAVGSGNDPEDILGLAHFCEHMLFLGTEKYPQESTYSAYLSEHGGSSNAYTSFDITNFYFTVGSSWLDGALDRFAQFFIAPLFTESATEREMCAVESEFQRSLSKESFLFDSFLKETMKCSHPRSRFHVGNTETLKGTDVRQRLFNFHDKHYSSKMMRLCVYGKESLDDLFNMIAPKFSLIPDNGRTTPERPWANETCLDPSKMGNLYYVKCLRSDIRLHMFWEVRGGSKFYKSGVVRYASHLVGHECEGSILRVLKDRNWAAQLICGAIIEISEVYSLMEVEIYLTPEGFENVNDVISLVFEYFSVVREHGFSEAAWIENRDTAEMDFRFRETSNPEHEVQNIARNMHRYAPEHVLSGDFRVWDRDEEETMDLLKSLTPENAIIAIKRSDFENVSIPVSLERNTKIYNVAYGMYKPPEELITRWRLCEHRDPALSMPLVNELIPTNFDLVPKLDKEVPRKPRLVYKTPLPGHTVSAKGYSAEVTAFHYQGDVYMMPKVGIKFLLVSPLAYVSPKARFLMRILVRLINEVTNNVSYYAMLANLIMRVQSTIDGIEISLSGFSQKATKLLEKVWTLIDQLDPSQELFDMCKHQDMQQLSNLLKAPPSSQASHLLSNASYLIRWSGSEVLESAEDTSLEDMKHFIAEFREYLRVSMLIIGNVDVEGAVDLAKKVGEWYPHKSKPLLPGRQPVHTRVLQLPMNGNFIVPAKESNETGKSSAVLFYCQIGPETPRLACLVDIFGRLVSSLFFQELRTKEQLGYVVNSSVHSLELVEGYRFIVESALCSPWYIYTRIRYFIDALDHWIKELSDADFKSVVSAEIDTRRDPPKTMKKDLDSWWSAICKRSFNFDHKKHEIEALEALTKQDLFNFFDTYISNKSPERRSLATFIYSKEHWSEVDELNKKWEESRYGSDDSATSPSPVLSVNRQLDPFRNVVSEPCSPHSDNPQLRKVAQTIIEGKAAPELLEVLAELGSSPDEVAKEGLPKELIEMLGINPSSSASPSSPASPSTESHLANITLSKDMNPPSIPVHYVMSYNCFKHTLGLFPLTHWSAC